MKSSLDHFWRQVVQCSTHSTSSAVGSMHGPTKVSNLDVALGVQQKVLGLDISMNDLSMGVKIFVKDHNIWSASLPSWNDNMRGHRPFDWYTWLRWPPQTCTRAGSSNFCTILPWEQIPGWGRLDIRRRNSQTVSECWDDAGGTGSRFLSCSEFIVLLILFETSLPKLVLNLRLLKLRLEQDFQSDDVFASLFSRKINISKLSLERKHLL